VEDENRKNSNKRLNTDSLAIKPLKPKMRRSQARLIEDEEVE